MSTKKPVLAAVVGACLLFSMPALAADDVAAATDNTTEQNTPNTPTDNGELNNAPDTPLNEEGQNQEEIPTPQQPSQNKAGVAQVRDKLLLYPANQTAIVNEEKILMPAAPFIDRDVTMVPLRFLTQDVLKATVTWNQESKTVTIISPE